MNAEPEYSGSATQEAEDRSNGLNSILMNNSRVNSVREENLTPQPARQKQTQAT